ncbi:MAG TPA: class I SAM-dependent methyltransferase [Candidatus Paceibacterota bacterium]|nr:class I SAM-dependent methyltransferase [Verrucomicrobiota bacterium]HRY46768.1 class I SAM-dependent methyltransferase [Candidatus Paceibacterota bacterium]
MIENPSHASPGCLLFEDEHLLVVNKPAGWNTHAPSPFAGEGIYEWLRHREARWASLAIIHRLDKETSGVLLFTKTPLANRSLTDQFANRQARKQYLLLTDRGVKNTELRASSHLVRLGDRYGSRSQSSNGQFAETRFRVVDRQPNRTLLTAEPGTGRTHQIRVHAADLGFPILGDSLYGGTHGKRLYLHAHALTVRHPATNREMRFEAPPEFESDPGLALREAILPSQGTNACRLVHGAFDGWPGLYVDRLGSVFLVQAEVSLTGDQLELVHFLAREIEGRMPKKQADVGRLPDASGLIDSAPDKNRKPASVTILHKLLRKDVRETDVSRASPVHLAGPPFSDAWGITENGVHYQLSSREGYSAGLFLDQRDNRRRLLTAHIAAGFPLFPTFAGRPAVLNTFAYTCGFSVCAALAGAQTVSLDLSRKYLEWGRENFRLNGLDPAGHEFIYGDCFDWLKRLARKQHRFDVIILDPPTFSTSKVSGVFRVEKNYDKLLKAALPLLKDDGVVLACANTARLAPEDFLAEIQTALRDCGRSIRQQHYVPQPPDFPVHREEPAYLKTVWMRIGQSQKS